MGFLSSLVYFSPYNQSFFLTRFAETGEALVSSVDKLIFVGSPGVGKMVWSSVG